MQHWWTAPVTRPRCGCCRFFSSCTSSIILIAPASRMRRSECLATWGSATACLVWAWASSLSVTWRCRFRGRCWRRTGARGLRSRDRNVSRPGVQRPRVWSGRGRLLYRLPGAADSGVAAGGELERAENDLGVDGDVGIADGTDGLSAYADAALPGAIFARACRGELFSGGDRLSEPLVHPERQGEGDRK